MNLIRRERPSAWPLEMVWPEDRVDRVFRDMFRNFLDTEGMLGRTFGEHSHLMRVEEYLEDDTWVIRAEMPGIDPDKDVEISVVDGVLHLRARREERKEEDRPDGYRSEFHYGGFQRSIQLPAGATEGDVKATYKDGILEIRVPAPKAAEAKPAVKIPIARS